MVGYLPTITTGKFFKATNRAPVINRVVENPRVVQRLEETNHDYVINRDNLPTVDVVTYMRTSPVQCAQEHHHTGPEVN